MKIIIGSESFSPNISGVAVHAELLAKNLAKGKNQICLFSPSRKYKSHIDRHYAGYKVYRLKSIINPFRRGFRVAFLPRKDIEREVNKFEPDLIHLEDPTSICSALLKVAKKKKIPVVITNHFSLEYILSYIRYLKPFHPLIRKILKRYLSNFYNKSDYILCPTETVRKELRTWGVKAKILAISNGVDLDRFYSYSSPSAIKLKYHLPENPIVLYAGRIDKDKSIQVLIKAIPTVVKSTNAHFVFMGSGDLLPKMKKMTEKLGVGEEVTFLGWMDHNNPDLPLIYQVASVFAIPSAIETQSIVTLEAMASGLPIVAARAGALPELVKNNENGFLFPVGNFEVMAEKIIKIIKSRVLSQSMKKKSLEIVTNHQIKDSFAKTKEIYEEIIRKNN